MLQDKPTSNRRITNLYPQKPNKAISQAVLALRGDKHIEQIVFNLRLRFGILNRPFTKDDFLQICKDENIHYFDDFQVANLQGFYYWCNKRRLIAVNPKLKGRQFLFIAFHELGHHFLHRHNQAEHRFSNQQTLGFYVIEAQANHFAELTLREVKKDAKF